MSFLQKEHKRKIWIITASVLLSLAVIAGACAVYVSDDYRADTDMISAFAPMNAVRIETLSDGAVVFQPDHATKGLIFYPGGKVEYTAYQPLMAACA